MIVYWLLLLPTALIAYLLGSMSTLVLSSNFIFRYNLRRLGRGNDWLTNFRRVYGLKGALVLLLVEVIKDIIPIIIGGVLLGIKGHAAVGRTFAGFCVVMGRLWPVYYRLHGSHAIMPLIVSALFADKSLGIVLVIVVVAVLAVTKYISLSAIASALVVLAASFLILEDRLCILLLLFTGLAVLIRHLPALKKISEGTETKIDLRKIDLTYKFENKF